MSEPPAGGPEPDAPRPGGGAAHPAAAPAPRTPDGATSFRPILSERALRRFDALTSRPRVQARVGIVVVNTQGQARSFPPHQRPTIGELLWSGSGSLYEVDMGLHHTSIELELPADEDAFAFPVTAHIEWQVVDPIRVVRDGVYDVRTALTPPLWQWLAATTRLVPVGRPAEAEARATGSLAGTDLGARYGIHAGTVLQFRTDSSSAEHAAARRAMQHKLEIENLEQEVRRAQEEHNKELLTARVDMYRAIIAAGDTDQFGLRLAQHPDDVAAVVQMIRDESHEERRQVTDFVNQLLASGAIDRWEIDDQVRAALNWLKESTNRVITPSETNRVVAAPPESPALPGGAALPRAGRAGKGPAGPPPPPAGGPEA